VAFEFDEKLNKQGVKTMNVHITNRYLKIIDEIGNLNWQGLERHELMMACRAYYYFSRQFVDAVHIACDLYPSDRNLISLREGECETDNLSPYPGIAEKGEKMNHDEFMKRVVDSASLDQLARERVDSFGHEYLAEVSRMDPLTRAMALSSYEDGGLEAVFHAILTAPDWNEPSLGAFKHFLVEHIKLDSGEGSHGSLCRHLVADDRILPLWIGFRDLLIRAAPSLSN
jgi:hypothetical protein